MMSDEKTISEKDCAFENYFDENYEQSFASPSLLVHLKEPY